MPDLDQAKSAVVNSQFTRRATWVPARPRISESGAGTINLRLPLVRRLAYEAPDSAGWSARMLRPVSAESRAVKKLGISLGNWAHCGAGQRPCAAPPEETLKGRRDRAFLAVLLLAAFESAPGNGAGDAAHSAAGKNIGRSSTCTARQVTPGVFQCRTGKAVLDQWTIAATSRAAGCFAGSTKLASHGVHTHD